MVALRIGVWAGHKYFLDKMGPGELVKAYFTHYAILSYLVLAAVCTALVFAWGEPGWAAALAAAAVVPIYPMFWYLLHRYVLHGAFLYKSPLTAPLWKRIHFDHHQDPNDLGVLFGALYTTLPTVALVTALTGWIIAGTAGAYAALASGLLITCFYEFCHCVQHLPFAPKFGWLRGIKKRHLAHHFHSEHGNYGITNFLWDRIFGTYYAHPRQIARSETVFNLGYTPAEAEHYPWVAELSEGSGTTHAPQASG